MSAPAANALSLPPRTMQRTSVVAVEALQRRDELLHELVRERVQRIGPVERDDGDRAVALGEDEVTHSSARGSA